MLKFSRGGLSAYRCAARHAITLMNGDSQFPQFYWMERTAPTPPALADPGGASTLALDGLSLDSARLHDQEIAVAVGSRGIGGLREIVRAACEWLIRQGARPFIVPAMGSHGGGTADGQRAVLAEYGITAETTGAEIRPSAETIATCETSEGFPVFAGRDAWTSGGILLINRVKPHTRFSGKIESGLLKMMAVGLGKADGAREVHRLASKHGFEKVIRAVAGATLAGGKIIAGLAIVENARHEPAFIRAATPANMADVEEAMLALAKSLLPKMPFPRLDLLIVDEIGKNIAGSGMDTKVTGRGIQLAPGGAPEINLLYARDLTAESEGNALGVGMADLIHERLYRKIDFGKMYVNARTSLNPAMARLPIRFSTDLEAIGFVLTALGSPAPAALRIARIRNTLSLNHILVSDALAAESHSLAGWSVGRDGARLQFDASGDFAPLAAW